MSEALSDLYMPLANIILAMGGVNPGVFLALGLLVAASLAPVLFPRR